DFIKHNETYSKERHRPNLPTPPSKKLLIVTCMDSRIDNFESLGLQLGEAHIIRNAGGCAKDALRSIIKAELPQDDPNATKALNDIEFMEFNDLEGSVRDDVKFLREHPLVLKETSITGWIFRVEDGKVHAL
ncbi:hypothetical protein MPER_02009, partial [Moniliophthora perniciosa FA553]